MDAQQQLQHQPQQQQQQPQPQQQQQQQQSYNSPMGYGQQQYTADQILAPQLQLDEHVQEQIDPNLHAQLMYTNAYLSEQQQRLQQQLRALQVAAQQFQGLNLNGQAQMMQQAYPNMYQQQMQNLQTLQQVQNLQAMMTPTTPQSNVYSVYDPATGQQTLYVDQGQAQAQAQLNAQYQNPPQQQQQQPQQQQQYEQAPPPPLQRPQSFYYSGAPTTAPINAYQNTGFAINTSSPLKQQFDSAPWAPSPHGTPAPTNTAPTPHPPPVSSTPYQHIQQPLSSPTPPPPSQPQKSKPKKQ